MSLVDSDLTRWAWHISPLSILKESKSTLRKSLRSYKMYILKVQNIELLDSIVEWSLQIITFRREAYPFFSMQLPLM